MTLHVDEAAERTLACMIEDLRSARRGAELSQDELAKRLPVRGRAISEWEIGSAEPTLDHLVQWCRELDRRLVIIGSDGEVRGGPLHPRRGEPQEVFERRRLAVPLRNRRLALKVKQGELGSRIGVSRDSIQRWELAHVSPRPISLIVWAQMLTYSVRLQAASPSQGLRTLAACTRQVGCP
jgi:transcriptional regulator with XRE-family HTH domain